MATSPNLYALLIGINHYLPKPLPNKGIYSPLTGCVRDVLLVENFLLKIKKIPNENIIKLTASSNGSTEPSEPSEKRPTYENIVKSIHQLEMLAKPGDQVYIHYSGHGGRVKTSFPEIKGDNGLDEALVPMDISDPSVPYLRDVEIAHILKRMLNKGLIPIVVLDCCFAGSMTRGGYTTDEGKFIKYTMIRGGDSEDTLPRSTTSLVASKEELIGTWRILMEESVGSVELGKGWFPQPKGYVLLAACHASEYAYESVFNGKTSNGALTYWLIKSLQNTRDKTTYRMLHERIRAKIHKYNFQQTPQLQGEGDRLIFDSERLFQEYGVTVMEVDSANNKLRLNTGISQGIMEGACFAIYKPGTINFTETGEHLALAKIIEARETYSLAEIVERFRPDNIEVAAQAILTDPGDIRLRKKVSMLYQEGGFPEVAQRTALRALEEHLQKSTAFLSLAGIDKDIDYQIGVNSNGEYEICFASGKTIDNLSPAIKIDEANAVIKLFQRLEHLAKYHNIEHLYNTDQDSPLRDKLLVEIYREGQTTPAWASNSLASTNSDGLSVKAGEVLRVRIQNQYPQNLNVTVLNVQPDWGVGQLYPDTTDFELIERGKELSFKFGVYLPTNYKEGNDVLKVFANINAINYRWLKLPSLENLAKNKRTTHTQFPIQDPLGELFEALVINGEKRRNAYLISSPNKWIAVNVKLKVDSR